MIDAHGGTYGPTHALAQVHALRSFGLQSKSELTFMDNLVETMVNACYESSATAAASGASQPGAIDVRTGTALRYSQSPPGVHLPHSHNGSLAPHDNTDAPDMTSGSSVASSHSPMSTQDMSPTTQSLYPNLQPAAATSQAHLPSSVPASTLGPQYAQDSRPRHSSSLLQRAAPTKAKKPSKLATTTNADDLDFPPSPKHATKKVQQAAGSADSNIDPALGGLLDVSVPEATRSATDDSSSEGNTILQG